MIRTFLLAAFLAASCGCQKDSDTPAGPPPEPMPTSSPNEVVIYVPTMVCESCPQKVAEGLTMLPWVDAESIQPDRKLRQVRFALKDPAAYDAAALTETVNRKGFKGVQILVSP